MNIRISDKDIGGTNPAFIIAEVAQSHDGSVGAAHAYIDAAADALSPSAESAWTVPDAEALRGAGDWVDGDD